MAGKNKEGILENLILEFSMEPGDIPELTGGGKQADKNMKIPLRLQILAEGFARKWNSQQVNEELVRQDCEPLYARSYYEAGLIYAFDHGMTYAEWRTFFRECMEIPEDHQIGDAYFQGGKITLRELKAYVLAESGENLQTALLTRWMEAEIREKGTQQDYRQFVRENLEKFSSVRERARYYFCKYLFYYIDDCCRQYYDSCEREELQRARYGNLQDKSERGVSERFALENLSFLKPLTKLKKDAEKQKNHMSLEEKRTYLENASLTPGGIFDEFNYFYFGYVSVEWMEILFELYGEFDSWPENMRLRVAHSLGLCGKNPNGAELEGAMKKLREMEREQREKEALEDSLSERSESARKKAYQKGRSGEDFFRDFITGKRDINRATLIAFLLFVKARISLDEDNKITVNRLNRILLNSGFAQLRPDRDFDRFVLGFLRSREPMDLLEEEVEKQVLQGKNFYLYKVYRDAYCHQKELLEYLI